VHVRPSRTALVTFGVALAAAAALAAVPAIREAVGDILRGDLSGLRAALSGAGPSAAALLVGVALVHIVVPFPAELPTAAAGYAFGFAVGFPLMLGAWVLSGLGAYTLARILGRPVVAGIAGERRIARAEGLVERAGPLVLLGIRLIPLLPFSLVCFACGVTRVPLGRYAWTMTLGTAPLTALTVLLGVRLQEPSLDDPVLWLVVAGMLAIVAIIHPVSRRLRADPPA